MKRTRQAFLSESNKKIKAIKTINLEKWKIFDKKVDSNLPYISATKVKNYLLKDPVLDWIEKYYEIYGFGDKNINREKINKEKKLIANEMNILKNTLFDKGNTFEKLIYDEIEKSIGKTNCVDVINNYKECCIEKMEDTIKYMASGIPVIRQAVLYNESNRTFGIADFIIRSDYINQLFDDDIEHINKDDEFIGCKFSDKYHYRVVDIKWSQLQLCSDGIKILNSDRYPCYKGQLAVYNLALGKIQNYIPNIAYILGKSYKYESKSKIYVSNNSFDRLGHIIYDDFDKKYIELTKEAIDWYRDMLENGSQWNLITSCKPELFPNMCNGNDAPYTNIKLELAQKKHEITSIWKVGIKNRENAFSKNIYSWLDDNCTSETLGVFKSIAKTVDNILDVNRNSKICCPDKIKSNMYDWRNQKDYLDFYIDFETINDVFYKDTVTIDNNKNNTYIFMVGVGYYDENKWIFKEFHMNKLNIDEEIRIIGEFKEYIYQIFKQKQPADNDNKIRFFHWSSAETTFLENFNDKTNLSITGFINNIEFADIYKLFITEPITINGSLSYKLKDISNALYNLGLIQSNWKNTNVTNGLGAMIDGCHYYKAAENNSLSDKEKELFNNIIKYNEIDCKVMGEIISWMRNNL